MQPYYSSLICNWSRIASACKSYCRLHVSNEQAYMWKDVIVLQSCCSSSLYVVLTSRYWNIQYRPGATYTLNAFRSRSHTKPNVIEHKAICIVRKHSNAICVWMRLRLRSKYTLHLDGTVGVSTEVTFECDFLPTKEKMERGRCQLAPAIGFMSVCLVLANTKLIVPLGRPRLNIKLHNNTKLRMLSTTKIPNWLLYLNHVKTWGKVF